MYHLSLGYNRKIVKKFIKFAAREAIEKGTSPIVIDNTNTQAWEMRAYVSLVSNLGFFII